MAGDLSKLIRRIYVHKGTSRLYQRACSTKDIYKPLPSLSHLCQELLMLIMEKFSCKSAHSDGRFKTRHLRRLSSS